MNINLAGEDHHICRWGGGRKASTCGVFYTRKSTGRQILCQLWSRTLIPLTFHSHGQLTISRSIKTGDTDCAHGPTLLAILWYRYYCSLYGFYKVVPNCLIIMSYVLLALFVSLLLPFIIPSVQFRASFSHGYVINIYINFNRTYPLTNVTRQTPCL